MQALSEGNNGTTALTAGSPATSWQQVEQLVCLLSIQLALMKEDVLEWLISLIYHRAWCACAGARPVLLPIVA
jgi:hypothetical protein